MEKGKKRNIKFNQYGKKPTFTFQSKEVFDENEMIFGTRAIMEAIHAGKEIEKLFIQKNLHNELIKNLISLARSSQVPISSVPIEKLNKITKKNHQGAICFISPIQYASLDNIITRCFEQGKMPLIIILDRITDVRNFGAIARTAECAGVDAIVIPDKGNAQITGDAMKTSAGALNYIAICRAPNLKEVITYLKNSGINVLACTEKSTEFIYEKMLDQPLAILIGSEENGISQAYLDLASEQAKIPMMGNIASLNVSVATSIILYEAVRQRKKFEG